MMVRLRISQSVSLSSHSGNAPLQMRVTSSLSGVPSPVPNDAVRCPALPPKCLLPGEGAIASADAARPPNPARIRGAENPL